MSDAEKEIKIYEDVPRTGLAVRTQDEARAALVRLRGDSPPNQCAFGCIMCGWKGTMELTDDEIAAVGGDVEMYGGPCPGFAKDKDNKPIYEKDQHGEPVLDAQGNPTPVPCLQLSLLPLSRMGTDAWTPGDQVAKREKLKQLREAAEVNAEVLVEKAAGAVAAVFAQSMPQPTMPNAPVDVAKPSE